ncbi:hypothetical protein BN946_scf184834.g8 [Trametes cinnabarina]|uniref:Uncharacterized protein n=1 Tax=Pycnoporus cinnabarinus TaxID=5643 RepID=A0A060S493_PYCCI|nr:hypothetical protein BN946_scf184834.g8 [Trametes cinnabarina]
MPRRSPPTPLRLHTGPLPPRGMPKHTLPSIPRPAFHGPTPLTMDDASKPVPRARMAHTDLPTLLIPDALMTGLPGIYGSALEAGTGSAGPSSPTSSASSRRAASLESGRKRSREWVRGPWDHSGAIHVPFDVGTVLPPPRPVAINVR